MRADDSVVLRVREFERPAWHAWLNDGALPVEWKNHNLYLRLPPGGGRIFLKYVDLPARISVAVSLLAWVVAIGVLLRLRRRTTG